jgi:hypothetical protein
MGKGKQVRKLRIGAVANAIEILLVLKKKVTRSQKHEHEYGEDTVVVKSLWKSVVIEKFCNRGSIARRPGYDYKGTHLANIQNQNVTTTTQEMRRKAGYHILGELLP